MNRLFKSVFLVLIVFFVSSSSYNVSFGQETKSKQADNSKESELLGFFGSINLEYLPVPENLATHVGLEAGVIFKKSIEVSLYGLWMVDKLKRRVIFPDGFQFHYYQGGLNVNYYFFPDKKFKPSAGLRFGYGFTAWDPLEGDAESFDDHIYLFQPRIGLQYQVLKFMIFQLTFGYTQAFDVQLIGIEEGDLDGLNFGFGIKMGRF